MPSGNKRETMSGGASAYRVRLNVFEKSRKKRGVDWKSLIKTHGTSLASDKITPPPLDGSVFVAGWHPTAAVAVPLTMIPGLQGAGFGR